MQNEITLLVLAAGASARFIKDKRSYTLPLLTKTLDALKERYAALTILYVLRESDRNNINTFFNADTSIDNKEIIFNPNAEQGMGASIAFAMSYVKTPNVLICLADMPFIGLNTFISLLELSDKAKIIAPIYQQQIGHPVIFGEDFYPELKALAGDKGAKSILLNHQDKLQLVASDDQGVIIDIDYQRDWLSALNLKLITNT